MGNLLPILERCDGEFPYQPYYYSDEEVAQCLKDNRKTCAEIVKVISPVVDPMPGVGHAKAVLHLIAGDEEGAKEAFLASTKTTAVMGAGAGGFLAFGPAGACIAGGYAGTIWDMGTFIATDGKRANGLHKIVKTALGDPTNVLGYVQGAAGIAGDVLSGYSGGKFAERMTR